MSSPVPPADQLVATTDLTFHPFPRMPSEIRLKVWNIVLRFRRIVTVRHAPALSEDIERMNYDSHANYDSWSGDSWDFSYYLRYERVMAENLACDTIAPAIFYVNREARYETLKFYTFQFHAQLDKPIYFNLANDVILFKTEASMSCFIAKTEEIEDINRIKTVMVPRTMVNRAYYAEDTYTAVANFEGLESLILEALTPSDHSGSQEGHAKYMT
ncbi:hypothetical protein DL98DRAFT_528298 [Cadophora sp. DSE1049]|nr:hypothetical protein DL98DRAFT_528298 [Cadophora sp. DSE1049]